MVTTLLRQSREIVKDPKRFLNDAVNDVWEWRKVDQGVWNAWAASASSHNENVVVATVMINANVPGVARAGCVVRFRQWGELDSCHGSIFEVLEFLSGCYHEV